MSKAREFWIEKEHWQKWYGGIKKYLSCFEEAQNEVDEYYHVIEYSEVERLKSENAFLRGERDNAMTALTLLGEPLKHQFEKLKSENQKLKEAAAVLVDAVTSTWVGEYGKVINRHNAEKLKKYREMMGE